MKTIAISQRMMIDENTKEVRDSLDTRWAKLFIELNFLPVLLPSGYDFKRYFNTFEISGVILSGGNDLYSFTKTDISKKRDNFEIELIKYCITNNVPIFGVCRGMQMVASYFQATFIKVPNHVRVHHKVNVSKESKYYSHLKNISMVNSFHEWSVDNVPSGLLVSVRAQDGVVEAIEGRSHKIWGQMWHPEREDIFNKNQIGLFHKFFER